MVPLYKLHMNLFGSYSINFTIACQHRFAVSVQLSGAWSEIMLFLPRPIIWFCR